MSPIPLYSLRRIFETIADGLRTNRSVRQCFEINWRAHTQNESLRSEYAAARTLTARGAGLSPVWHNHRRAGSEFRECESLNGNVNRQNCGGNLRVNATAAAGAKGFSKVGFYTAAIIGEQSIPRFYLYSAVRTAIVCFRAPCGLIKNGINNDAGET